MKRLLTAVLSIFMVTPASAATKRVRVPVDSLPRVDNPVAIAAKDAVLPEGVRDGSTMPARWRMRPREAPAQESGHCTDGRRASIGNVNNDSFLTEKIWETNGKVFLDRATVKIEGDKINVTSAERISVVYVGESTWAYRRATHVALVFASDSALRGRAWINFGCSLLEIMVPLPAGSAVIESSPERVTTLMNELLDMSGDGTKREKRPPWTGIAFRGLATVSRSSADEAQMLNLVIDGP